VIQQAIDPMLVPDGICLSPDGHTLYVSKTPTGRVWRFDIASPGKIRPEPWPLPNGGTSLSQLPGYQQCDPFAVQADGAVCVGTLIKGGINIIDQQTGSGVTVNTAGTGAIDGGDDHSLRRTYREVAVKRGIGVEEMIARRFDDIPVGRVGRPDEVGALCVSLLGLRWLHHGANHHPGRWPGVVPLLN
jgi:hypothetical protein